jgi:hypothetical protein
MREYTPRRASRRWLDADCPPGVLAIFDHPNEFERYTVFVRRRVRRERGHRGAVGLRHLHLTHPSRRRKTVTLTRRAR